jgi:hypothetical protein
VDEKLKPWYNSSERGCTMITPEIVKGIVRHIIQAGAVATGTTGFMTENEIALFAGAVGTVICFIWSVIDKRKKND